MVLCADCGNNCCNAGTGDVDGKRCGCDEAYAHQDLHHKDPAGIQFAADDRETAKVEGKAAMEQGGFRRGRDMNREELEQLKVDFPDLFAESGEVVSLPVTPAGGPTS